MTLNGNSDYVTTTTLVAKALQHHNRTLRMLSIDHSPEEDGEIFYTVEGDSHSYDFYEYLLHLSQHSQTLLRRNAEIVREAYTQMLYCNPVLEVLWMNIDSDDDCGDEDEEDAISPVIVTSEMQMLLRLNRHGVRQTLFDVSRGAVSNIEWVEAIASQSYDINALFFLMSRNPALCSSSLPPCSANVKHELRDETEAQASALPTRAPKRQRTTETIM